MKLLLENWREYLNENVFYVKIEKILPTEELGHGKDHTCPSEECEKLINKKIKSIKSGELKPIEVCRQKPVNTYRVQDQELADKSGMAEPFYYVLNGHHRLEAAKRLGLDKMPVFLTPKEPIKK